MNTQRNFRQRRLQRPQITNNELQRRQLQSQLDRQRNAQIQGNSRNRVVNRVGNPYPIPNYRLPYPQRSLRYNLATRQYWNTNPISFDRAINNYQTLGQPYYNGGLVAPSLTRNLETAVPQATGFSMINSGERNVTFSKEFIAGFLDVTGSDDGFKAIEISTHPSLNATLVAISQLYQRYKITEYCFKYKASCPTTTTGLHFTGVDYGNQIALPATFTEAESLEHFSVGPLWKDSQDWHHLKLSNLRERWFSTNFNSGDPDSRPARIIFGSMRAQNGRSAILGVIEVKATYLFNGLAQNFTASPPGKIFNKTATNGSQDDVESAPEIVELMDNP